MPDPIQFPVAFFLKAHLLATFISCILTDDEFGSAQVIPQLQQIIDDLDSFL
jgi:hypothetical protein